MEKRHLKFIPIALATTLFTLASCVDNSYDLTDDIDLTIQVGGSEFAIPAGETEPIPLSKILKIEEDGVVKIDPSGNYYLLQEGSQQNTDIFVKGFQVSSPDINPIEEELNFNIPSFAGGNTPNEDIDADLPEKTTAFDLEGADLPNDIKDLTAVDVDMEALIHFSFSPAVAQNLNLKDVVLSFPKFIKSPKLTNGKLSIKGLKADSRNGIDIIVPIDEIDCKNQEGVIFNKETRELSIRGTIALDGLVSINTGEIDHSFTGPTTVNLTADIILRDILTKERVINVNGVKGIVQPDIDIHVNPITLSGLPDFLDDEKVTLSVENPMVFFMTNNNTPVAANVNGVITAFKNEGDREVQLGDPNNPVTFNFTIAKESTQKFCLSPIAPANLDGATHVSVPNLPTLITKIPDFFKFNIETEATKDETMIKLNRTYSIITDYDVNVPFVFGKNITTIVYKDTVDGWYDDLKDYEVKQVNATATAYNKIPLGLNLTAKALTVDAQDNPIVLDGVTVTVVVDGKEDGIIKAGKNDTAAESALVIKIIEKTPGAVKKLDGLAFEIVAATTEGAQGQQLNENQTLQLKNVRLKVPGGATIDLN